MKKILTFAILLSSMCVVAQESDMDYRSIIYQIEDNNHAEQQHLTYTLENGGLRIQGYMYTNCCGLHVLNCLVMDGYIFLSRSDMGYLCDCKMNHKVDIFIENIPNNNYFITLDTYSCDNGTYDEAEIKASSISQVAEGEYSIHYMDKYCVLTFLDKKMLQGCYVEVYDSFGIKIWEQECYGGNIQIPIKALDGGVCICKIISDQDSYSIKLKNM